MLESRPEPLKARLKVRAAAQTCSLSRVLAPFVVLELLPHSVAASHVGDEIEIVIEAADDERLERAARKIGGLVAVSSVEVERIETTGRRLALVG